AGFREKSSFPYDPFEVKDERSHVDPSTLSFRIPDRQVSKLLKLCKGSDYMVHFVLLAGLSVLLHKYNPTEDGTNDIVVGTPIYEETVEAKFVNTVLPIRTSPHWDLTFKDLLLQVRQAVIEAGENQNFPLERMLYNLDIPFDAGEDFPLCDAALLLENIHDKSYLDRIKLNIIFSFNREGETINAEVEYNPGRYSRES
ncbi:MAG: hypothetical protein GY940_04575, partial [bacterium]|nr:hypothetical protein [bacterium]